MASLACRGRIVKVRKVSLSLYFTAAASHLDFNPSLLDASISRFCEIQQLDNALHSLSQFDRLGLDAAPSHRTYISLIKACNQKKSLTQLQKFHSHLVLHTSRLPSCLVDYVVITFAKCGALDLALDIFCRFRQQNPFTWTALISGFIKCGRFLEAFDMHQRMLDEDIELNECTFISLLKACGNILDLDQGRKLHSDARNKGYTSNIFVNSTLISMYGKCGSIREAEDVFVELPERNVVSWNAMLSAYAGYEQGEKVLLLYRQMIEEGFISNEQSILMAIQGCGSLAWKEDVQNFSLKSIALEIGQALHSHAVRKNVSSQAFVGNTLVSMYGKCRAVNEATYAFRSLSQCDVVSWNAIISACIEDDQGEMALLLYKQMQVEDVCPNKLTLVLALQACGILGEKEEHDAKSVAWKIGQALHADCRRKGDASDYVVGSALVSMYGSCGTILESENVFARLSYRDVVAWNTMLSVCVERGDGEKALQLFASMQKEPCALDHSTLIPLLQACRQLGSMETCKQLHFILLCSSFDMNPVLESTLIHVYGSCGGDMVDAQAVFHMVLQPNVVAWTACIAGHGKGGSFVTCLHIHEEMHLTGITPNHITSLSLIYACNHAGHVDKVAEYFGLMSMDVGTARDLKHYACMVGTLGRAGRLNKVETVLGSMPMQGDWTFWFGLLGACRRHGNAELGKQAFEVASYLEPKAAAAYILMAGIYDEADLPGYGEE